jgi:hypothetical protein
MTNTFNFMSFAMTVFHSYLLSHHSGFEPLAGVDSTRVTTDQISYYRQYVTVLCQHSAFLLQGRDTTDFLQGQLCGDIKKLSKKQALYTAHCTPKGRVFANMLLHKIGENYQAISPTSNAEALIERLKKFVLFAKVSISTPESAPVLLECAGPDTAAALTPWFAELPQTAMATAQQGGLRITRLPGERDRWLLQADTDELAIEVWQALVPTHCPVGLQAHRRQPVEAGVVEVGLELQEAFLPQMINLDQLGGMSLKKGCYVGQEVIARTTNLGKLKRHLYRAELPGDANPAVGAHITDAAGSVLGTVANSYYDPDSDTTPLLAVIAQRGLEQPLQCGDNPLQQIESLRVV